MVWVSKFRVRGDDKKPAGKAALHQAASECWEGEELPQTTLVTASVILFGY